MNVCVYSGFRCIIIDIVMAILLSTLSRYCKHVKNTSNHHFCCASREFFFGWLLDFLLSDFWPASIWCFRQNTPGVTFPHKQTIACPVDPNLILMGMISWQPWIEDPWVHVSQELEISRSSTDDLWGIVEKAKRRRGKTAQRKGTVQALWQNPVGPCCFCFMLSQDSTWTFWFMLISKGIKVFFFFSQGLGPEIPKIVDVNFNSNAHLVTQKFQKFPLIPSHNFPGWVTLSKHLQLKHLEFTHRSKKRRKNVNKKCKWRKKNNAWSCRRRWGSLGWKFVMVCGRLDRR